MLKETNKGEFVLYDNVIREAKDAYTARKLQKDRKKLKIWINALLEEKDLIVFHMEDGIEKVDVISKKHDGKDFYPDAPLSWETVGHDTYLVLDYILAYQKPSDMAIAIHVNDITRFMTTSNNITDISKKIDWFGYGHH